MKIIKTDNFQRDEMSDSLVAETLSPYYAKIIVKLLNKKLSGNESQSYFREVKDDYELYRVKY